jgi:Domain of unknown function (DUF222)
MPDEPSAGREPRGESTPRRRPRGGSGFGSGDALDAALPGLALAGFADEVTGTEQGFAGVDDDALIGVLVAWQKTEAWAAAGRLSAVAELIRRRPVTGFGDSPGPASPADLGGPVAPARPGDSSGPGKPAVDEAAIDPSGPDGGMSRDKIPAHWGKFAADELAVALACSRRAAERMLPLAHDLAVRLPATARALREGVIDVYKAQIIAEATRVLDDTAAASAETQVIPDVAGKTPGQIRVLIGRAVLRADPNAGRQRREQAQKDARVELWREDAGTAAICGFGLPPDEALAADQAISDRAAELKAAGVPGTIDQLRVCAYLDVLLGQDSRLTQGQPGQKGRHGQDEQAPAAPGNDDATGDHGQAARNGQSREHGPASESRPATDPGTAGQRAGAAARINLTIPLATLLGLADHPGEAAGFGPLDAGMARGMATAAAASPATTWCITLTDQHGHPIGHGCSRPGRHRKARRKRGPGGLPGTTGPPGTSRLTDSSTGPSGRPARPPGTGPPGTGPTGGYGTWRLRPAPGGPDLTVDLEPLAVTNCDHRHHTSAHDPSDRLRHLIDIRDGECTYPPCRRNARRCDFEHAIPWEAGGKTCACNAGPRCRHHHHQKQAAGWRLTQHLPGYHTWTTPSGRQYTNGPITYPI